MHLSAKMYLSEMSKRIKMTKKNKLIQSLLQKKEYNVK